MLAVKGVYNKGKVVPKETIPYKDSRNVIIIFPDTQKAENKTVGKKESRQSIIKKINDVYDQIDTREFECFAQTGAEVIRNTTKNDTW
jgi:hypothetical protein